MPTKYKASGELGSTYGLAVNGSYYIQIKYPAKFGQVHEKEKEGQWGWDWWINTKNVEEIEEFPSDCDLDELIE